MLEEALMLLSAFSIQNSLLTRVSVVCFGQNLVVPVDILTKYFFKLMRRREVRWIILVEYDGESGK